MIDPTRFKGKLPLCIKRKLSGYTATGTSQNLYEIHCAVITGHLLLAFHGVLHILTIERKVKFIQQPLAACLRNEIA